MQIQFDTTISLGNVITTGSVLLLAAFTWRDLTWRIKNLEVWRREHMIDSDARDVLIADMKTIVNHVRWQTDYMRGVRKAPPDAD